MNDVVEGQEHCPIESRYFSGFFILSVHLSVQVLDQVKEKTYTDYRNGQEYSPFPD